MDLENQGHISDAGMSAEHPEHDWEGVYSRLVSHFAHRSRMDAEDLAQETLARVVKWLNQGNFIEGDAGFVKFVFGCARKVLFEYMRERVRAEREVAVEEAETKSTWPRESGPERRIAMLEALSRLTEAERVWLIRAEFEPAEMLAKEMGVPLSTFRVKIFRARLRLQALMNESRAPEKGEIFPAATP